MLFLLFWAVSEESLNLFQMIFPHSWEILRSFHFLRMTLSEYFVIEDLSLIPVPIAQWIPSCYGLASIVQRIEHWPSKPDM